MEGRGHATAEGMRVRDGGGGHATAEGMRVRDGGHATAEGMGGEGTLQLRG